jgi:methylmalonyl-CoA mutase
MTEKIEPLVLDLEDNGAFPTIDDAKWRELVGKALGGADFEKRLVKKTGDGIMVQPLYGPGVTGRASSLPGQLPFTRGGSAASDLTRPWDATLRVDHPNLKRANEIIVEGLEGGVSRVDLVLADHTRPGLVIKDLDDMTALMEGVDLSLISIVVSGDEKAGQVAGLVARLGGPKVVSGSIGLDPLGTLATRGGLTASLEETLSFAGFYAQKTSEMTDKFRTMNVDLRGYDGAGAPPAFSLGIAMATGVTYLRALEAAGLSIDEAANQITFTLTTDTDLFGSIAKLRAARTLWSRIVVASGGSPQVAAMDLSVETATAMMTKRDAHTNILRTAIAGFGAAIGGAKAISILPFTHALGLPTELGRRIARNIHVLLAEESSLGRVMDPAGGSFALEALSEETAKSAWATFQNFEAKGRLGEALKSGSLQSQLAAHRTSQSADIATRRTGITGVSEFPDLDEVSVQIEEVPTALSPMPDFTERVEALASFRYASDFETLRDAAESFETTAGQAPSVFLANLGSLADFTARAAFAQNVFESGGLRALGNAGFENTAEVAKAFTKSGARVACLCSTDTLYKDQAMKVVIALRAVGAKAVYLAGKPGDEKASYEAAGLTGFIFIGCNVLQILNDAHRVIGADT